MTGTLWLDLLIILARVGFAFAFVLGLLPVLIWAERKGAAIIQDRPGPNRAHLGGIRAAGMAHTLADVIKLVFKEDLVPSGVDRRWWALAPLIGMTVALTVFAVVPWGEPLRLGGDLTIPMQVADIDGGVLFILALTSLSVYGTMLAGWASNNKFSLLGGLRASAQMISYELALGLTVLSSFLFAGSVRLDEIVAQQAGPVWRWGVFHGFGLIGIPAFLLFFIAIFAETNRVPFDLPEGEAELVGGFHTEYASLRFALFFMGEYAAMIVSAAVTTSLFWGGYELPFLPGDTIRAHADGVLVAVGVAGVVISLGFVAWAWSRRGGRFRRALPEGDARLRENPFWLTVWALAALSAAGLGALGLTGWLSRTALGPELLVLVLHLGAFTAKTLFGCWCFIWVRWTLPRFRYDQLMALGWRRLLPWSIGLVLASGVWVVMVG